MLRIRNNLIGEFSISNVIYDDTLGEYDFYGHDGLVLFSLELNDEEFEAVAAYLGEEIIDEDKPTGVFSLEAAA